VEEVREKKGELEEEKYLGEYEIDRHRIVRELMVQRDTLMAPVPSRFQTLESSRLYCEPGSPFVEYVTRLPEPSTPEHRPSTFESYSGGLTLLPLQQLTRQPV